MLPALLATPAYYLSEAFRVVDVFNDQGSIMQLIRIVILLAGLAATVSAQDVGDSWPQFRGPLGTGEAPNAKPPVEWSETKNVRWKIDLPGLGHSTPVLWRDRLFVTAAVPFGPEFPGKPDTAPGAHDNLRVTQRHRFVVTAINRKDGEKLWSKTLFETVPHEGGHHTSSLASASPVCDDKHVFAYFGSHGLFCLEHDGELVWKKDLGDMQSKHAHGEGSSPALYQNTLIVNWDHEGQSFIVAYDKNTGDERWRKNRAELTSWSSPIVIEHKGQPQVIVCGSNAIRAYDLKDGSVIWSCSGLSMNVCATPVYSKGVLLAGSSYDTRNFLAIKVDGAKGDVTGSSNVLWSRKQGPPYVPSPLAYGGAVYYLRHYQGVLSRMEIETGELVPGPMRLPSITDVYSSPVAADGRVYVTDLLGTTCVLEASAKPKLLARNKLDDSFSATAVMVGNEIYLRGKRHLYRISEDR